MRRQSSQHRYRHVPILAVLLDESEGQRVVEATISAIAAVSSRVHRPRRVGDLIRPRWGASGDDEAAAGVATVRTSA
jgi:hypothetical protein